MPRAKTAAISDVNALKRLFKGLVDKVSRQQEAASAIAVVVMQLKSESRKRAGSGARGDSWLLFTGPGKVGKWKMANALSELVFGTGPTTVCFGGAASRTGGDDGGQNVKSRGRTSMDRVVEAVRRNPFSMIVLEDADQADGLVRGRIKRAMEQGRLVDSYGWEVGLGSVFFILTSSWLPKELKRTHDSLIQCEEKILQSAGHRWRLQLSAQRTPGTRCFDWLRDSDRSVKLRRQSSSGGGLSLDLNLAVSREDEAGEGSRSLSDLTMEHKHKGRLAARCSMSPSASDLMELVDKAISAIMGYGSSLKIDDDVIDRVVGGIWVGRAAFDEWAEGVLTPCLRQLKCRLRADDVAAVVRLSVVKGGGAATNGDQDWLPATVVIAVDELQKTPWT
ncbi:protein SMAX1-like [Musa acuminata AAA Group]|uniref:protein SMAX1-like n=1 Tax=Musa acuminata AAA Group TaxID=214697 RepID=UPI0031D0899D